MAVPNRTGVPEKTSQTDQYVLNYSFDEVYRILMVGLAAYNPTTGNYDRVQIGSDGSLTTGSTSTVYKKLYDFDTAGTYIYTGEAQPGTASTGATWRINKVTFDASGNPTAKLWANGTSNFDKTWTNRTSYTYSI